MKMKFTAWMIAGIFCVLTARIPAAESAQFSHAPLDETLKTYVKDGRVDYKALKMRQARADSAGPLSEYIDSLGRVPQAEYDAWSETDKIAFWINAYNAITLQIIVTNYPITKMLIPAGIPFPTNSIRQIPGQWDKITHSIMGRKMTLNDIEHGTLRKLFKEPRIHMALVCAAKGCPPLRGEAYEGSRLNEQLDDQARVYLTSPAGFKLDAGGKRVSFSAIFQWFSEDFLNVYGDPKEPKWLADKKRAVIAFASNYVGPQEREFLRKANYQMSFLSYDWSLNER